MGIPLDKLVDDKSNVYELTCVAIQDANLLAASGDKEFDAEHPGEKITSAALSKALNGEIEYKLPDSEAN